MTTLDHTALPLPAASYSAFWKRAIRGCLVLIRTWKNRQQFKRLVDLSDWELADIGVTRADLFRADAHGYGDPTARLNMVVSARLSGEDAARRVH